jgi:hypothetical protein
MDINDPFGGLGKPEGYSLKLDAAGMNLLALKGEVSCKRYISYEVRSVRKLFNGGVYYHFL